MMSVSAVNEEVEVEVKVKEEKMEEKEKEKEKEKETNSVSVEVEADKVEQPGTKPKRFIDESLFFAFGLRRT
jgi:hypothetical protein